MLNIRIVTVKAKDMPYDTVGNYRIEKDGCWVIEVVDVGNWKYEALVAIHEFVEFILIKASGVTIRAIDDFDIQFEIERKAGLHGDDEPGDDPSAPYHLQHGIATVAERAAAAFMGVNWSEYSRVLGDVYFPESRSKKK